MMLLSKAITQRSSLFTNDSAKQLMPFQNVKHISCFVILTAILFTSLMLMAKLKPSFFSFDVYIAQIVYSVRTPHLDKLMVLITQIGDSTSLISVSTLLALMLFALRLWKTSLICIAGFLTSTLTVGFIKVYVNRARPINDLYSGSESFSFPSGHMTNSTVVLGALGLFVAFSLQGLWRKIVLFLTAVLVILIGLSRVYLGAHWPSDILGGALLGTALLIIIQVSITHFDPVARLKLKTFHMLAITALAGFVWLTHVSTNENLPKYNIGNALISTDEISASSNQ